MTGLTLPGMIDDPGWTAGNVIPANSARDPQDIRRRIVQQQLTCRALKVV
jgi:hypothetical protein